MKKNHIRNNRSETGIAQEGLEEKLQIFLTIVARHINSSSTS